MFSRLRGPRRPSATRSLAGATTRAYTALPPDRREHTAVVAESYLYAVFLDLQAPPGDDRTDVLHLGADPGPLRPLFAEVRPVGPVGTETSLWLLRSREMPWSTFWPGLRHLDVA